MGVITFFVCISASFRSVAHKVRNCLEFCKYYLNQLIIFVIKSLRFLSPNALLVAIFLFAGVPEYMLSVVMGK